MFGSLIYPVLIFVCGVREGPASICCLQRSGFPSSVLRRDCPCSPWNVFLCPSIEGHLSCFQFLTVMNKAVITLCVQVFISLEQILRSGFAGSCRRSVFNFMETSRPFLVWVHHTAVCENSGCFTSSWSLCHQLFVGAF